MSNAGEGNTKENWFTVAKDNMKQHIEQYAGNNINFNLMALCRSPLGSVQGRSAENAHTMSGLKGDLAVIGPDWDVLTQSGAVASLNAHRESNGRSGDLMNNYATPSAASNRLGAGSDPGVLLSAYRDLVYGRNALQTSNMYEVALVSQADEQVASGISDHTPAIYKFVADLIGTGELKEVVIDIKETRNR